MLVPVLRCLYAQNQNIQITLVTRKRFVPIFKEFNELQIISPDFIGKHKGLKGLYRLYKELKQIKPNRIADIHHNLRTRILRLFFRLSFTRVKVIDKGYAERKRLTHPTKKTMKPLTPQHYRYVEVFSRLGFALDVDKHEFPIKPGLPKSSLQIRPSSRQKMDWDCALCCTPWQNISPRLDAKGSGLSSTAAHGLSVWSWSQGSCANPCLGQGLSPCDSACFGDAFFGSARFDCKSRCHDFDGFSQWPFGSQFWGASHYIVGHDTSLFRIFCIWTKQPPACRSRKIPQSTHLGLWQNGTQRLSRCHADHHAQKRSLKWFWKRSSYTSSKSTTTRSLTQLA